MSLYRTKTTPARYGSEKSQSRSIENALFLDNEYKNGMGSTIYIFCYALWWGTGFAVPNQTKLPNQIIC